MTPAGSSARKTKIVCTIGPATASEERLSALIREGMNVARLNFSHGTHDEHGRVIERIRRLSGGLDLPVAILLDLAGPKVRVGSFEGGLVELKAGETFTLTTRAIEGNAREASVSYPGLPDEVRAGDTLLLADGTIELRAERVTERDIVSRVMVGGALSSHKGVNCPSGLFGLPILREKDLDDLRFGIERGVDYIGLSFVRTAEDVRTARDAITKTGGSAPVIAKIETSAALQNFDSILIEADGVMVARGDLGIETPFSRVPMVQKRLIASANIHAKPVITATQMLYSMVHAPRLTRAEVADVANAVIDGTDAVMLSEETTIGDYPVESVRTIATIARDAERSVPAAVERRWQRGNEALPAAATGTDTLAEAACRIAARLQVDAIGTVTESGWTARFVAKYRPQQPILAMSPRVRTCRALALVRGVTPLQLPEEARTREEMMTAAEKIVRRSGWQGKRAVIVSSTSDDRHYLMTTSL